MPSQSQSSQQLYQRQQALIHTLIAYCIQQQQQLHRQSNHYDNSSMILASLLAQLKRLRDHKEASQLFTSSNAHSRGDVSAVVGAGKLWGPATTPLEHFHTPHKLIHYLTTLCNEHGLTNTAFAHVRSDYYDLTLEERKTILGADSVEWLCKSVIMENIRVEDKEENNTFPSSDANLSNNIDNPWDLPTIPRYILVIIQYTSKSHKANLARAVFTALNGRLNKNKMNWRLADEQIAKQMSGYGHNAMTPLGMQTPLPILMSDRVISLPYIWLGGGHVDVKWRVNPRDFANYFYAHVADITSN